MAYERQDNPSRRVEKRKVRVRVKLTCGCTALLRDWPRHGGVKLGCQSGQGHGYSLAWVEWTDPESGRTQLNRTIN